VLTPIHHPGCRDVSVTVELEGTSHTYSPGNLPGTLRVLTIPFTSRGGKPATLTVNWEAGEAGKTYRLKEASRNAPKVPAAATTGLGEEDDEEGLDGELDGDLGDELEEAPTDGSIEREALAAMPVHIAAHTPVIEARLPVGLPLFKPDKLLYRPGEKGKLMLKMKNYAKGSREVEIAVTVRTGLGDTQALLKRSFTVDAGGEELTIPFEAHEKWGAEFKAVITSNGQREVWREYCSASANFWEVGIGHAYPVFTQGAYGQSMLNRLPRELRGKYSNWIDLFFWAPCDWSKLTPPGKLWWGGQTSYPHDRDTLMALIKALQKEGIRASAYVNRAASGPFGWELARQHPNWFGGGRFSGRHYKVEVLDHYNDPAWRAKREKEEKEQDVGWMTLGADFNQTAVLDHGIDQIIESAKVLGWDAVRFDGHYRTPFDNTSTRNMRYLKERVLKAHPDFRFGFNWGRAPEWMGGYTHELREAMAGGNMYMQEGIRHWSYTNASYRSWKHYAANELRISKRIQSLGGHYHCILELQAKELTPAQRFYKLAYSLIAGAHPAYGTHPAVPGSPSWGAFMTRWSGLLWNRDLKVVKDPEAIAAVGNKTLQWKPFAQEAVVAKDRKQIVLHLLNPPTNDHIWKGPLPPPVKGAVPVTFTPRAGETIKRVWLVRPDREPFGIPLSMKKTNGRVEVSVPGMKHWGIIIAEVNGAFTVPAVPPSFTEQPDLSKVPAGPGTRVSADPNKQAEEPAVSGAAGFERLLNHGSANIGQCVVDDPNSPLGKVQGRLKEQKSIRMGMWWMGTSLLGDYEVSLRVKWTDNRGTVVPQKLEAWIGDHEGGGKLGTGSKHHAVLVTPGYPNPPEGAITLGAPGVYRNYPILRVPKWRPGCFNFVAMATTPTTGEHQIFQERLIFKLVRPFTDTEVLERLKLPARPATLRTPDGAAPKKVLVHSGMFWKLYLKNAPFEVTQAYDLPGIHEKLYQYDAIILANLGPGPIWHRRLFRDFVADGGRVIYLGGNHAFPVVDFTNTFASQLLPVVLNKENRVMKLPRPLLLGDARGVPHKDRPALFWRHDVTPHPEATVLAWAGDHPIAFRRSVGKGIVTAFTGTVLGKATKGETPFWQTKYWQALLMKMVTE
jgi:hypothetical protein